MFPIDCGCDSEGSKNLQCNELSECECKSDLITGTKCDECAYGYYGFPDCTGNFYWCHTFVNFQ